MTNRLDFTDPIGFTDPTGMYVHNDFSMLPKEVVTHYNRYLSNPSWSDPLPHDPIPLYRPDEVICIGKKDFRVVHRAFMDVAVHYGLLIDLTDTEQNDVKSTFCPFLQQFLVLTATLKGKMGIIQTRESKEREGDESNHFHGKSVNGIDEQKQCKNIEDIPPELLVRIFSLCGPFSPVCIFVCKDWSRLYIEHITPKCVEKLSYKDPISVEFLKWSTRHCRVRISRNLSFGAASRGDVQLLQWLKKNKCPLDRNICKTAAREGHLEALQWARENECPWDEDTCAYAAKGGHLEALKWLREKVCPWNEWTCAQAAREGHLEVLKWAREHECPWDEWTCARAAAGGHLEVLQWARENGCPWDEDTCAYAALGGHLEVLQWARENGCPWDEWTCAHAAGGGHTHILEYLKENNCPGIRKYYNA